MSRSFSTARKRAAHGLDWLALAIVVGFILWAVFRGAS